MSTLGAGHSAAARPATWLRRAQWMLYLLALLISSVLGLLLPFGVAYGFAWDNETGWWAGLGVAILLALMSIGPLLLLAGTRRSRRLGSPSGFRLQAIGGIVWILSWTTGIWGLVTVILTAVRGG